MQNVVPEASCDVSTKLTFTMHAVHTSCTGTLQCGVLMQPCSSPSGGNFGKMKPRVEASWPFLVG